MPPLSGFKCTAEDGIGLDIWAGCKEGGYLDTWVGGKEMERLMVNG